MLSSKYLRLLNAFRPIHEIRCSRFCSSFHNRTMENTSLNSPDLNWDFILDPKNKQLIEDTIHQRKGVGNINLIHEISERLKTCTDEKRLALKQKLIQEGALIPNLSHPDSPIGDESNAKTVFVNGEKKSFNFPPKTVVELCENLGILRTHDVNLTTGNKTYYFVDKLAKLEHALVKFTLDKLRTNGFELVSVPDLLSSQIVEASGFRSTGDVAQVYRLDVMKHPALCLSGTAELAVGGMHANEIFDFDRLPQKIATVSRCYRAETSDLEHERGIYRVHQFTKVEMYGLVANDSGDESCDLLEEFVNLQKDIFSSLGLHYRVLDMPTHELGAPAYRKYDIETWMPGKKFYGEISSASNCTDFQSRRLHTKYRSPSGVLRHVHTVNGTACAIPRLIMALVENNQTNDGQIHIPEQLRPFTNFSVIDDSSRNNLIVKLSKKLKNK